jgi:hypothetical protein
VGFTWGGTVPIEATRPSPPITPIQIRRCRWILHRGPRVWVTMSLGYLIIVAPRRRYWRPTRNQSINLARRIRAGTISVA